MDGKIWLYLALIFLFCGVGVILRGRRLSGVNNPSQCANCETPISMRPASISQLLLLRGIWICPHCGARIKGDGNSSAMRPREKTMGIRVPLGFVLVAFASLGVGADGPMPWAFVNGAAKGYSIKLESASPTPGTPVTVGQTVEFKFTLSYELSLKDKGAIVLVIQDETNKHLDDGKQQSAAVTRGTGTITLTQSLVVPAGGKEVRFFIPLVPGGVSNTSGELLIRYPVADTSNASSIGYPSVAAALADLHSRSDVKFSVQNGWTIAEDRSHFAFWSFPPEGDPAYPSAVKRTAVQTSTGINMDMKILCQSTQAACDKLDADFNALNERMRASFKNK